MNLFIFHLKYIDSGYPLWAQLLLQFCTDCFETLHVLHGMRMCNLRNSHALQTVDAKSNNYYHSFLPLTVRKWNNLPSDITQSESVAYFKHNLNRDNSVVSKHFYTGKRHAQILHTRLRTNCSALNYYLFLKNITDFPLCCCGDIENTYHFFFQCPHCRNSRIELFEAVSQCKEISLDLLLFGDISLSYNTNEKIFEKVQKYIITT